MDLVWATTLKYVRRNPGLSLASIVIITVTFSLGAIFLVVNSFAWNAVQYLQSQPTLSVLYDPKEKEDTILAFKQKLEAQPGVLKVTYVTSEEIQKQYLSSLGISSDSQSLYTVDANPMRTLRIQVKPGEDFKPYLKMIDDEKNRGSLIIGSIYLQDVVDKVKEFSNTVTIGSLAITIVLLIISLVLVYLTIGFTINRFSQEIEIMQLVGAEPKVIAMPFMLQGAYYGTVAALISFTTLIGIWAIAVLVLKGNLLFTFIQNMMGSVGLDTLFKPSPIFLVFGVVEVGLGAVIGYGCSYFATRRYIKD